MIKKLLKGALRRTLRNSRILKYRLLSTNSWTGHPPLSLQATLLAGRGRITFGENVRIGVGASPSFWSSECYIEARSQHSEVKIGGNTWINNGFSAIAEGSSISIGCDCLIGHNVFIINTNFHPVNPDSRREGGKAKSQDVSIGNNVFIGSSVTILKNTHIGADSVVAAGSVVSGIFPERSLIAGNPAKFMKSI